MPTLNTKLYINHFVSYLRQEIFLVRKIVLETKKKKMRA